MDSKSRRDIRLALANQGFRRTHYTLDLGDGVYSETWVLDGNEVVIQWGERKPVKRDAPQPWVTPEEAARFEFAHLEPSDIESMQSLVRKMLALPNGRLGEFTSEDARRYWREYARLLNVTEEG